MFEGGAESARTLLSTIPGSMITLAGTLYSITFVVLVLASQQFAPRVLRGFMRDRTQQAASAVGEGATAALMIRDHVRHQG